MIITADKIDAKTYRINDVVDVAYKENNGELIVTLEFDEKKINQESAKKLSQELTTLLSNIKEHK